MAGYLLFQEGTRSDLREHALLRGLTRAGDAELVGLPDSMGPTGTLGTLFVFREPDEAKRWPKLGYDGPRQVWKKVDSGSFWFGWMTAKPPTPEDLSRKSVGADGYRCLLNDGNEWVIPSGPLLPCDFDLGDDGKLIERVKTPWRATYERTVEAFGWASELLPLTEPITAENRDRIANYCGELLSINYRLTPALAVLMGLWDAATLWRALVLSTDVVAINRLIDDLQKKRESATGGG